MTSVLYVIRSLDVGGAERQVVTQACGLSDRGFRTAVATFYPGGAFQGELESAGVPVRSLGKRSKSDFLGFSQRFVRVVRDENPDVVYSFMTGANVAAATLKWFWGRRPLMWGIRGSEVEVGAYGRSIGLAIAASVRLASVPDRIAANSIAGAAHYTKIGYPAERMRVIPNGIDTAKFSIGRGTPQARTAWRLAPNECTIGLVARLDPMKGHVTFFQAVALLVAQGHRIRAICVGTGLESYRRVLLDAAASAGLSDRVEWIAKADDLPDLYRSLDVAVSASSFGEGFSNSIAEAMACGVPCVVTNVGDSAEIVGTSSRPVPARNPRALADEIAAALATRSPGVDLARRKRIVDNFSVESLLDRTAELIHGLV